MGIIEKDLNIAALSFKADDFDLMNIIGNRIMSDSLFINNINFAIAGFFVKQVALTFVNLKPQLADSEFLEVKLSGDKYIACLLARNVKVDIVQNWVDYHKFNLDLRKYPATGLNRQIAEEYGDDPEATTKIRKWLIDFLNANKILFCDNHNNFVKGILNELQRTGIAFGYQVEDTVIFSCLLALDRFYDYFRVQNLNFNGEINSDSVKTRFFPFVERLSALSTAATLNLEEANVLLWDLIKGWREYFIFYQEITPRVPSKQVELSKETKAKLSEVLGKAIQKELKT